MDFGYSLLSCEVHGQSLDIESELNAFRSQWQEELRLQSEVLLPGGDDEQQTPTEDELPSTEEQATYLYHQGVNAEANGQLYIAIRYYRRATQLVPDIEFRAQPKYIADGEQSDSASDSDDENDDISDLVMRFSRIVFSDGAICQANFESKALGHISTLPVELLMYIFKWVVSSHIDTLSLEQLSRAIITAESGVTLNTVVGVYLAKTSYYRCGEKGLDNFYHPYHVVYYYRYLHFFADGHLLMFTSSDDPVTVLPRIRSQTARLQGLLFGIYRITGNQVAAVLKRRTNSGGRYRRARREADSTDGTFHVEFVVQRSGRRPYGKLVWERYSNHTVPRSSGQESRTDFDLNDKSFPPLIFCRVKSYTMTADTPLQ